MVPVAAALVLAGCGAQGQKPPKRTPEAGYVVVRTTTLPVTAELTGRVTAFQTSEVRPQVTGLIQRRLFTEGALVRQGQTLYEIDPSLFAAAGNQASANLAAAQAAAEAARARADRFKPLAEIQAVSAQDYTDALAQARQAEAQVAQARAALQTARINLRFTRVPAPISGRIGRSLFTEGALVTGNQAQPLAVIQRLDPIFVDIRESAADLLALRRALAQGGALPSKAAVQLKLEDGSDYGFRGDVEFTEVTVDAATGTVTLRARFPNPQGLLLPGMFVRAMFAQSVATNVMLVPQQGIQRDPRGNATALVIGPDNKVVAKPVTTLRTEGANWVVSAGLNPGDRVITEGSLNAKPGTVVKPVPAGSPQRIAPPPTGKPGR
ncbi:efflux RND transporter periplasmic adaptor subunit [Sphingomonas sp.]|uniref:efflux RND transporter periplasmic adaptor subunit n=1 Tax=Sphingomonas sp. TaxID=28214 RepID=UPI001DFED6DC|nr:efflux RND transporter periplasmic adaptor subunit [Sphingomonas sp.]MBX9797686.1 efflux RND transporter periplasmic adaptor subunit [Sphingomonas sp.]